MVERVYPINISFHFHKSIYLKYDNKSTYKNLSKDDKSNIKEKIIEFITAELNENKIGYFGEDTTKLEIDIFDDIIIK